MTTSKQMVTTGLLAGLSGGIAEMVWIGIYSAAAPITLADAGRGIAATLSPSIAETPWAPWAGAGIHLALSLALGLGFLLMLRLAFATRPAARTIWAVALLALAGIWATNFLLVLPAVNPAFVTLMPYGVSLASKLLFAVAMASALQYGVARDFEPRAGRRLFLESPLHHAFKR